MPGPIDRFSLTDPFAYRHTAGEDDASSDTSSSSEHASPHLLQLGDIGRIPQERTFSARHMAGVPSRTYTFREDLAATETVAPVEESNLRTVTAQMRQALESTAKHESRGGSFSRENRNAVDFVIRRMNEHGLANREAWTLSSNDRLQGGYVISHSARTLPDKRTFLEVESMVALPGSKGYGSAILELAANHAQQRGHAGRIMAEPIANSRSFFEQMGFEEHDGALYLDPAKSDQWSLRDEKWVLNQARQKAPFTD